MVYQWQFRSHYHDGHGNDHQESSGRPMEQNTNILIMNLSSR